MFRRKTRQHPMLPVVELQRLMTAPVPSEVIAELSTPVLRALLQHMVMEARYGSE